MSILFVTNRNIVNTCGELRLIKNRAICLQKEYGKNTEFLVCRSNKCELKAQEAIGASSTIRKFLYAKNNPFSIINSFKCLKKTVFERLSNNEYEAIILSGSLVLPLGKKIKKKHPTAKIVIDVHGALEEIIEFKKKSFLKRIINSIIYRILKNIERKYMKYSDGFLAVSVALKEYLIHEYNLVGKEFFIIPCAQERQHLQIEEKKVNRLKNRAKYKVNDDEKLFIYSGGLSPWQCIEESVRLFREIYKVDKKAKMLILSGDIEGIRKYEGDGILVDSLPYYLVNEVLCAGDYAFMLRDDFITNEVAYPNKFIEYVASGMKIIATSHVADVAQQIKTYDIGVITDFSREILTSFIEKQNKYFDDIEERQALLDDVCFENRLRPFVQFMEEER